jgi:hypothetical protein
MEHLHYPIKTIIGLSVAAVLSLYGALDFYGAQTDYNKAMNDPYHMAEQEKRFELLEREVPPDARLGYVSDLKFDPAVILGAEYALAPRLLVAKAPHELVIGNFSRPQDYAEFGRKRGLTLVKEFPNGVILFREPNQ